MNGNLILRGCLSIKLMILQVLPCKVYHSSVDFHDSKATQSIYNKPGKAYRNEARLCSYIIEMAKSLSYFFNWEFPLLIASTIELA